MILLLILFFLSISSLISFLYLLSLVICLLIDVLLSSKLDTWFSRLDIYFFTCDGKKVATMEEVIAYNNMYYENMKIKKTDDFSQKSGMHR